MAVASITVFANLKASEVDQPYNLQLGPVNIRADAGVSGSYNDNINYASKNRQSDFILNPTVGIHGNWQISEMNTLTFDIGLGYEIYAEHFQYSYVTISPDSQVSFNFSIGDVQVNLHNQFSYQQDPLLVAQLSNSSRFPILTDVAGFGLSLDLSDIVLSLGYDHTLQLITEDTFKYLDFNEETITPKITFKINPSISAGISTSFSYTKYDNNPENDNTSIRGGPFVTAQISSHLSVNAQAGYVLTTYSDQGSTSSSNNISSYYGSLGVTHQINEALDESLTAGKDYIPGLASNYTERYYVDYLLNWKITKFISAGLNLSAENLKDSTGTFPTGNPAIPSEDEDNLNSSNPNVSQTSNRFQGGINFNYKLTAHANLDIRYQYTLKDSNVSDLSFYANAITAEYTYNF